MARPDAPGPHLAVGRTPPDPLDTQQLLERVRLGDRVAERQLFDSLTPFVRATARSQPAMRALRAHVDEDDVIAEVWLRCYAAGLLVEFEHRGAGSLQALFTTLVGRTLTDLLRRYGASKRDGPLESSSVDELEALAVAGTGMPSSHETTPTARARASELESLCRDALETREWEIWRLAEVDGLDAPAIAERFGLTSSAVRGVLFRARKKLVRALDSSL